MSDDQEQILLALNMDDADFVQKILNAKASLKSLGEKSDVQGFLDNFETMKGKIDALSGESIPKLLNAFMSMAPEIAAVVGAGLAIKEAFDLAKTSEDVNAVNKEFDILTTNVGLSSAALKEQILASKGLMSETEAIKASNEAVLRLGVSAQALPQVFELSRKAGMALGMDTTEVMSMLTQSIASGNQRLLRRLGLSVDVAKAQRDYAAEIGVSVDVLSQQGKTQANLNAVLAQGALKFAGVTESIRPMGVSLTSLGTTSKELYEAIASTLGPPLAKMFSVVFGEINNVLEGTRRIWVNLFGSDLEKSKVNISTTTEYVASLTKKLADMKAGLIAGNSTDIANLEAEIKAKSDRLKLLTDQVATEQKAASSGKEAAAAAKASADALIRAQSVDHELQKKNEAAFQVEMSKIRSQVVADDIKNASSTEQFDAAARSRRLANEAAFQAQLAKIKSDPKYSNKQKLQMEDLLQQQHSRSMAEVEFKSLKEREAAWDNYANHATGVMDSISRSSQAASKKAQLEMQSGVKMGEEAYKELQTTAVGVFEQIGQGAATGSSNVEKVVLGSLGTMAEKQGEVMLLAGLWPPNPAVLAGGAALLALGGALSGLGGGSSSSSSSSASSISSGGAATATNATTAAAPAAPAASAASQTQAKQLSIVVQGSVIDTDTKMRLVDMLREATDTTGYSYTQIGGT